MTRDLVAAGRARRRRSTGAGWELTAGRPSAIPGHARRDAASRAAVDSRRLGEAALDAVIEARGTRRHASIGERLANDRGLEDTARGADRHSPRRRLHGRAHGRRLGWILAENHCPICAAARTCQGFCRSELALFRSLLAPANVTRVEYLLDGARRCAYRIRRRHRTEMRHSAVFSEDQPADNGGALPTPTSPRE